MRCGSQGEILRSFFFGGRGRRDHARRARAETAGKPTGWAESESARWRARWSPTPAERRFAGPRHEHLVQTRTQLLLAEHAGLVSVPRVKPSLESLLKLLTRDLTILVLVQFGRQWRAQKHARPKTCRYTRSYSSRLGRWRRTPATKRRHHGAFRPARQLIVDRLRARFHKSSHRFDRLAKQAGNWSE